MQRVGSRAQVMHGNAKMTGGGLKKKDLKYNKQGKIVSKKMSQRAKKEKRLQKAGYTTVKGQFGAVRIMKGGLIKACSELCHTRTNKTLFKLSRECIDGYEQTTCKKFRIKLKQELKNAALNLTQYKVHIVRIIMTQKLELLPSFSKLFEDNGTNMEEFTKKLNNTGLIKNIGNNKDVFNLDEMEQFYGAFNNFCKEHKIEEPEFSFDVYNQFEQLTSSLKNSK